MPEVRRILVTGATGNQGGAAVSSLREAGQHVRVMTRQPEKAQRLKGPDVEIVRGDFDDRESLLKALSGVHGAYIVGTPYEGGVDAEVKHGKAMIDACLESRVDHVVYSSVASADKATGIPHFESKFTVEKYLKSSGLRYTILRPVWFMENFGSPWYLPSIQKGVLSTPLRPDRDLQMISVGDIGKFVAAAFTRPSEFGGRELDLAGDELTMEKTVMEISRVLGQIVRYEPIPEDRAEEAVGRDWARMFTWFNERGYDVDIEALRKRFGIPLTSFRQYLERTRLAGRKAA